MEFKPQPGKQSDFLGSAADIAIYGGAAGSGKSFALLLCPLRHINNPKFNAVIFRRNTTHIRTPGGLWSESMPIYSAFGAVPKETTLDWTFKSGMKIKFWHLEHENSVYNWQGAQVPFIGFDELVHFSASQFFYMLSRNRSMSGIPGYVRGTCNPDADSWVRDFLAWWIDDETGLAIPERSGVLRWFLRRGDDLIWANTKQELIDTYGRDEMPKSVTFISAALSDNKILMDNDPAYLANLRALSRVDRLRLLSGDWNVRASAGMIFKREWFTVIDAVPSGWLSSIRFWDRAASPPSEVNKDPDWTRGLKLYRYPDNTYVVADLKSLRDTPGQVERLIKSVASHDGIETRVMSQQDPGSAGVSEAEYFTRMLPGFDVRTRTYNKDKLTRAKPVSAQVEAGNIRVLRAPWNDEFFRELENFPEGAHDDIVDTLSAGFNELNVGISMLDVFRNL